MRFDRRSRHSKRKQQSEQWASTVITATCEGDVGGSVPSKFDVQVRKVRFGASTKVTRLWVALASAGDGRRVSGGEVERWQGHPGFPGRQKPKKMCWIKGSLALSTGCLEFCCQQHNVVKRDDVHRRHAIAEGAEDVACFRHEQGRTQPDVC